MVEKVEPVQVHFTLRLRDQRSMWMARWIQTLHGFLHGIQWIMFHGRLDCYQKPPLGGRPNTKSGDHDTQNAHNCWFILLYHARRPAWIEIHWNSIWSRVRSYDFTLHLRVRDHTTWVWGWVGTAFGHFLSGSHNFMVTARVWSTLIRATFIKRLNNIPNISMWRFPWKKAPLISLLLVP